MQYFSGLFSIMVQAYHEWNALFWSDPILQSILFTLWASFVLFELYRLVSQGRSKGLKQWLWEAAYLLLSGSLVLLSLYKMGWMWIWPYALLVLSALIQTTLTWKDLQYFGLGLVFSGMVLSNFGSSFKILWAQFHSIECVLILSLIGGSAAFLMYGVKMIDKFKAADQENSEPKSVTSIDTTLNPGLYERLLIRVMLYLGRMNFLIINPVILTVGGYLLLNSLASQGWIISTQCFVISGFWFWACGLLPAQWVTAELLKQSGQRLGKWFDQRIAKVNKKDPISWTTLMAGAIALPTTLAAMGNAYWCGKNILGQIEFLLNQQGFFVSGLHAYPILNTSLGILFMILTLFAAGVLYFEFTEKELKRFDRSAQNERQTPEKTESLWFKGYAVIAAIVITDVYLKRMDVMLLDFHLPNVVLIGVTLLAMLTVWINFYLSFSNRIERLVEIHSGQLSSFEIGKNCLEKTETEQEKNQDDPSNGYQETNNTIK